MKKLILLGLPIAFIAAGVVYATPAPKVFVCKYVGKPGVDERLQTGNNPISVSSNSVKDYKGVGSWFNDAQGRSYVLEVDNGQPEPNVSNCPKADAPVTPEVPSTPPPANTTPQTTTQTTTTSTPSDTKVIEAGK